MPWPDIVGHEAILDRFRRNLRQKRLASTFLFVGPEGIGKRTVALKLAQALLCESTSPFDLDACLACTGCQMAAANTHPDLIVVEKPADRSFIPIELLIGDREHRLREGLCHDIALKPFRGGRKIALIDDADDLNQEGANCLLKTLEEPPAGSLIILIGTSEQRQLPTIRSRCQIVRFSPLAPHQIAELLRRELACDDPQQIASLASRAAGSLRQAIELADDELQESRRWLLEQLSQCDFDLVSMVKDVTALVDAAGKDAPPRRARLHQLIQAAAGFYRQLMRDLAGTAADGDEHVQPFVTQARRRWTGDADAAAGCLDRCLEAANQVDANANPPTLVACWLDDLARIALENTTRK